MKRLAEVAVTPLSFDSRTTLFFAEVEGYTPRWLKQSSAVATAVSPYTMYVGMDTAYTEDVQSPNNLILIERDGLGRITKFKGDAV